MKSPQSHIADWRSVTALALLLACGLAHSLSGADDSEKRIDFASQVRPLLAAKCYECHGPEAQEGDLRLDIRADALRGGASGVVITKHASGESRLYELLVSTDPDERMPLDKKPLTPEEISVIRRWIDEGADWPDAWSGDVASLKAAHWSFGPPVRPQIPKTESGDQIRNAVDSFVVARLSSKGLRPSPPADRYTLIRRVYLDLVGIPPSPEEADEFVRDSRPDAYERLVDRLLSSPAYGERWARRWLDLARYADTNGYEKDRPRSIWPYRDWVIRALNADMPFDQFSIKQLAGDMLPQATLDDRVATGFHRNTMLNEEGGIDPLEFRFHAMVDRVSTTGTTWLGLTIACAQCHSHKYDPILQNEYYQFLAFLNNADEPELELPHDATDQQRQEKLSEINRLIADLPNRFPIPSSKTETGDSDESKRRQELIQRKFASWMQAEVEKAVPWTVLPPAAASSNLPLLTIQSDHSILASGDQTKSDRYAIEFHTPLQQVTSLRLEALPDDSLPLHGPGRAYYEGPKGDFFLSEIRVEADSQPVTFRRATHDYSKLAIGSGDNGAQLTFDGDMTTGWSTKDREGEPHAAVYNLSKPIDIRDRLTVQLIFERHYSCGLGRFRISATTAEREAEARGHSAEIEEILVKPAEQRTQPENEKLYQRFLESTPELADARAEIQKLRDSLPKPLTTLVMAERPPHYPRPTYVHHRGEFLQPGEVVSPALPRFLPTLSPGTPANRLGLAQWLVSRENPLTARVTVNRQWQALFGRGLVRTTEDFGVQGEPPTHPQLLDWLSCELMDTGWSLKKLHREIVTSATYCQSSRLTESLAAVDPENVLLSRGPRVRLEAELIRDAVLQAAGLLSNKMGGPGVFPPQPESVTTEGTYGKFPWNASIGEDRYRRGLYTYMKRTAPFALYLTFDGPSGEACVARRDVSNSPLQALAMLNDVMFLEAAQALARVTLDEAKTDESRAEFILRRCLVRPPDSEERERLVQFARSQRQRFAGGELDPKKFGGPGTGDPVEQATWTAAARAVLNLNEMIEKN